MIFDRVRLLILWVRIKGLMNSFWTIFKRVFGFDDKPTPPTPAPRNRPVIDWIKNWWKK